MTHVNEVVNMTLMVSANSWYMSANIPGKPRAFLPYLGPEGVGGYRKKCDEVAAKGYEGFAIGVALPGPPRAGITRNQTILARQGEPGGSRTTAAACPTSDRTGGDK